MTNAEYKSKALIGLDPIYPAIGGLVPRSPVTWAPTRALQHAQDAVIASSRRIVARWSVGGHTDWHVPTGSTDPSGAGQAYPDADWRTLATYRARVTPGCELRAYAVHCPSGIAEKLVGSNYISDGAWGRVRVGVTWANGGSSTGPHYRSAELPGSPDGTYGGLEASLAGENWTFSRVTSIGRHRPPGYLDTASVAATYSEWSEVTIAIAVSGGARVIEVVVYESPAVHVTDHADDGLTSAHASLPTHAELTVGPVTRAPDGQDHEEHRFGSRRIAQVAERQSERLGPRIMQWSCWDESDASIWNQAEGNPVTITSTSYVHLLDSTITTYATHTPGWVVAGSHAKLHRLCDPTLIARDEFAVVPVRVYVDASRSAGDGVVRVQCGLYDWVDVPITGTRAVYEMTGYLESQAYADHDGGKLVIFGRVASGTLSIYNVSVDFGTWA